MQLARAKPRRRRNRFWIYSNSRMTAWGGGWNALILSEYFVYRGHTYKVLGLGALLDAATYETGNNLMILLSLLSMVVVVVSLNRLVWRRLYNVATERYRFD